MFVLAFKPRPQGFREKGREWWRSSASSGLDFLHSDGESLPRLRASLKALRWLKTSAVRSRKMNSSFADCTTAAPLLTSRNSCFPEVNVSMASPAANVCQDVQILCCVKSLWLDWFGGFMSAVAPVFVSLPLPVLRCPVAPGEEPLRVDRQARDGSQQLCGQGVLLHCTLLCLGR